MDIFTLNAMMGALARAEKNITTENWYSRSFLSTKSLRVVRLIDVLFYHKDFEIIRRFTVKFGY